MATKKRQRFTKWRISDVLAAGLKARAIGDRAATIGSAMKEWLAEDTRSALQQSNITVPLAVGFVDETGHARSETWLTLTHEQRCDLIVAEARRLNVPKRAR